MSIDIFELFAAENFYSRAVIPLFGLGLSFCKLLDKKFLRQADSDSKSPCASARASFERKSADKEISRSPAISTILIELPRDSPRRRRRNQGSAVTRATAISIASALICRAPSGRGPFQAGYPMLRSFLTPSWAVIFRAFGPKATAVCDQIN